VSRIAQKHIDALLADLVAAGAPRAFFRRDLDTVVISYPWKLGYGFTAWIHVPAKLVRARDPWLVAYVMAKAAHKRDWFLSQQQ
jgi:hypothetical protein